MKTGTALALLAALLPAGAFAQERWPQRPVRIVVTFPPGGTSDLVARLLAPRLGEALGQQVVVENRPGADGMIGAEAVARSAPDGYTLLAANVGPNALAPSMHRKIRYDAVADFSHLAHIGSSPHVLLVNKTFPPRSLKEFVALARAQPGRIDFGSGGPINHFIGELFKREAKIAITHVPYKGAVASLQELRGGMIPAAVAPLPGNVELVRSGALRALAVTSDKRSELAPELPTFVEQGYPGVVVANWVGISAPARLPEAIGARLATELARALAAPEMRKRMVELGLTPDYRGGGDFSRLVREDIERWRPIVVAAGAQAD